MQSLATTFDDAFPHVMISAKEPDDVNAEEVPATEVSAAPICPPNLTSHVCIVTGVTIRCACCILGAQGDNQAAEEEFKDAQARPTQLRYHPPSACPST
jgi:hypothetical protein